MPGAEPDAKWVDRGLILSRDRMLSSHGCCVRIAGTAITLLRLVWEGVKRRIAGTAVAL